MKDYNVFNVQRSGDFRSIDKIIESLTAYLTTNFVEAGKNILQAPIDYFNKLVDVQTGLPTAHISAVKEMASGNLKTLREKFGDNITYNFYKVYVPTLRGLRTLENKDIYLDRTKKDYFEQSKLSDGLIFTGLNLYNDVQSLQQGDFNERETIAEFQRFLGEQFFEGAEIALIPRVKSDVLYVKIGNEKEYPIYNLGDGIQQLIIMTFPMFMHQDKNLLLFIEEPELYLHPGLQRKFLELLTEDSVLQGSVQAFLTTHSNHFLDLSLDFDQISIYSFQKILDDKPAKEVEAKFKFKLVSSGDRNLLQELGVMNSSVFLSNCTIWVEGITDRYYFRKYLEIYQDSLPPAERRYKEDLHYAFVEYGGANITHWSFLEEENQPINCEKLCGPLFLITDRDDYDKKEKIRKRHDLLQKKLGDRYYCLTCREVENLLSPAVIKGTITDLEGKDVEIKDFAQGNYNNKKIGAFIESVIISEHQKYDSDSGALKSNLKVKFAKAAAQHMRGVEDLSEEALDIAQRIYEHIKANNR